MLYDNHEMTCLLQRSNGIKCHRVLSQIRRQGSRAWFLFEIMPFSRQRCRISITTFPEIGIKFPAATQLLRRLPRSPYVIVLAIYFRSPCLFRATLHRQIFTGAIMPYRRTIVVAAHIIMALEATIIARYRLFRC